MGKLRRRFADCLVEYARYVAWLNAAPEPVHTGKGKPPPPGRERRKDIEQVLGEIPLPEIYGGEYLVAVLFRIGPIRKEEPISDEDIGHWERRRGVELAPWEADILVEMSRAYMSQMHAASKMAAPPPWPPAVKMWKYVTDKINAPQEAPRNGRSQ